MGEYEIVYDYNFIKRIKVQMQFTWPPNLGLRNA